MIDTVEPRDPTETDVYIAGAGMTPSDRSVFAPERRVEMLSDPWYDAFSRILAEEINQRSTELADVAYTICEVITDAPGRGEAAHWFTVRGGEVTFGRGRLDDVDCRLTVGHDLALRIARAQMAELDPAAVAGAAASGQLVHEGTPVAAVSVALAEAFRATHDRLAHATV